MRPDVFALVDELPNVLGKAVALVGYIESSYCPIADLEAALFNLDVFNETLDGEDLSISISYLRKVSNEYLVPQLEYGSPSGFLYDYDFFRALDTGVQSLRSDNEFSYGKNRDEDSFRYSYGVLKVMVGDMIRNVEHMLSIYRSWENQQRGEELEWA